MDAFDFIGAQMNRAIELINVRTPVKYEVRIDDGYVQTAVEHFRTNYPDHAPLVSALGKPSLIRDAILTVVFAETDHDLWSQYIFHANRVNTGVENQNFDDAAEHRELRQNVLAKLATLHPNGVEVSTDHVRRAIVAFDLTAPEP